DPSHVGRRRRGYIIGFESWRESAWDGAERCLNGLEAGRLRVLRGLVIVLNHGLGRAVGIKRCAKAVLDGLAVKWESVRTREYRTREGMIENLQFRPRDPGDKNLQRILSLLEPTEMREKAPTAPGGTKQLRDLTAVQLRGPARMTRHLELHQNIPTT